MSSSSELELHDIDPSEILRVVSCLQPPNAIANPLRRAVATDDVAGVRKLLRGNHHTINLPDNTGYSLLHSAVQYESIQVLEYLLSFKEALIDAQTFQSETPLTLSVLLKSPFTVVKRLLDRGADVNIPMLGGTTALHMSVCFKDPLVSRLLIEHGADLNVRDKDGATPLHEAAQHGNSETVAMLVCYGASVNEFTPDSEWSPFDVAVVFHSDLTAAKILMNYVIDLEKSRGFCYLISNTTKFKQTDVLEVFEDMIENLQFHLTHPDLYLTIIKLCESPSERLKYTWLLLSRGFEFTLKDVYYLYCDAGLFSPEINAIFASETVIRGKGDVLLLDDFIDYCWPGLNTLRVKSLVEISRDTIRKVIYRIHQRDSYLGAYNAIQRLEVPNLIRDILLLRKSIEQRPSNLFLLI